MHEKRHSAIFFGVLVRWLAEGELSELLCHDVKFLEERLTDSYMSPGLIMSVNDVLQDATCL